MSWQSTPFCRSKISGSRSGNSRNGDRGRQQRVQARIRQQVNRLLQPLPVAGVARRDGAILPTWLATIFSRRL
jgi:hypothetical protein